MKVLEIVLFWLMTLGAIGFFIWTMRQRLATLQAGLPDNRFDQPWVRLKGVFVLALAQKRMHRDRYAGIYHFLIFWGFCVLGLRSVELVLEGLFGWHLTTALGTFGLGYQTTKDIFEVLVLVGIGMAMLRRAVAKPWRLENSLDAWGTLSFIAAIMVTDLLADGAYIWLYNPAWKDWAPVSLWVANLLRPLGGTALLVVYKSMWWLHLAALYGFANFLPYSKHFHVFTSLFNIYFRELEPNKNLKPMDMEAEHFGINKIQDFTWKQMLDFYTCVECGRCLENCPTTLTGKPLRPKDFGNDLRDYLKATPLAQMGQDQPAPADRPLIGGPVPEGSHWQRDDEAAPWSKEQLEGWISKDTIWACTSCGYCEWACPLQISFVDKLVGMRRFLTLEESDFPAEAQVAFKGMERQGNPWNLAQADRGKWAEGLEVPTMAENPEAEYLFWVGCAGSYDAAGQKVSQSLVKLLKAAGVSFAILGTEESCTCESARRLGNEYLFQTATETNVELLKGYGVKKVITNCPHCLNTLKNEYPDFGGTFEVVHGTELVAELIATGRLKLDQTVDVDLTYHDPCYLSRYNGQVDAPRAILGAIPGVKLTEMDKHGEATMCCGAGGGRFWLEEHLGKRVNHERFEQAMETKATTIAVGCPFCNVMLNNAAGETGREGIATTDVLELAAKALKA
ncbi:MAG: (Fe-S)-binding protein [Acidobacteria bacterium]|nr:(Fe-S)-binding protein [Acidobacteriota bacterium]